MDAEKYLQYIDNLKEGYDAFYFQNKYSEIDKTTHSEEFTELIKLFEKDDNSIQVVLHSELLLR